jgi:hypothetical protein
MATHDDNFGVILYDIQQLSNCSGDKVKVNPAGQNVSCQNKTRQPMYVRTRINVTLGRFRATIVGTEK